MAVTVDNKVVSDPGEIYISRFLLNDSGGSTGSISGTVFNDGNQDGVFDAGDTALAQRVIYIDANNNGKLDSGEKTADANSSGVYTFTGLAAGTYIIRRSDTPAGYTYSEPVSGFYSITLTAGQTVSGKDIGVFQGTSSGSTGSISGTVFNDVNEDGTFDAGDTALSARVIYIDANNNGQLDAGEITADANPNGVYTFTGLTAGTYIIRRADTPAGYTYSEPISGYVRITLSAWPSRHRQRHRRLPTRRRKRRASSSAMTNKTEFSTPATPGGIPHGSHRCEQQRQTRPADTADETADGHTCRRRLHHPPQDTPAGYTTPSRPGLLRYQHPDGEIIPAKTSASSKALAVAHLASPSRLIARS